MAESGKEYVGGIKGRAIEVRSAERLRNTMAQMAEGIEGINIAVDESAQGVTVAAQSTGR